MPDFVLCPPLVPILGRITAKEPVPLEAIRDAKAFDGFNFRAMIREACEGTQGVWFDAKRERGRRRLFERDIEAFEDEYFQMRELLQAQVAKLGIKLEQLVARILDDPELPEFYDLFSLVEQCEELFRHVKGIDADTTPRPPLRQSDARQTGSSTRLETPLELESALGDDIRADEGLGLFFPAPEFDPVAEAFRSRRESPKRPLPPRPSDSSPSKSPRTTLSHVHPAPPRPAGSIISSRDSDSGAQASTSADRLSAKGPFPDPSRLLTEAARPGKDFDPRKPADLARIVDPLRLNVGPVFCLRCNGQHKVSGCYDGFTTIRKTRKPCLVEPGKGFKLATVIGNLCVPLNMKGFCSGQWTKAPYGPCRLVHRCSFCLGHDHGAFLCPEHQEDRLREGYENHRLRAAPPSTVAARQGTPVTGGTAPPAGEGSGVAVATRVATPRFKMTLDPRVKQGRLPQTVDPQPFGPDYVGTRVPPGGREHRWPIPGDADYAPPPVPSVEELKRLYVTGPARQQEPAVAVYPHLPLVEQRPGYVGNLSLSDCLGNCPDDEARDLAERILLACVTSPGARDHRIGRDLDKREADNLINNIKLEEDLVIRNSQSEAKPFARGHFHLEGIRDRFQTLDGSVTAAPAVVMINFPSDHDDSEHVLTPLAYSTRLIISSGIEIPVNTRPGSLAVYNALPVKFKVPETGRSQAICTRMPGDAASGRAYPRRITKYVEDKRIEQHSGWLNEGKSKLVVTFGSEFPKAVREGLARQVETSGNGKVVRWSTDPVLPLEDWEMAIECPELSLLTDDCVDRVIPFPADDSLDPLFPHNNSVRANQQQQLRTDDRISRSDPKSFSSLEWTLVYRGEGATSNGILYLALPHPQNTKVPTAEKSKSFALDLGLGVLRNALAGELESPVEPPVWEACRLRAEALDKKDMSQRVDHWRSIQQRTFVNNAVRHFRSTSLPREFRRRHDQVIIKPVIDDEGFLSGRDLVQNEHDALARVSWQIAKVGRRPALNLGPAEAQAQREAQLADARKKKAVAQPRHASRSTGTAEEPVLTVCECAVPHRAPLELSHDLPLIQRRKVGSSKTARHPPNQTRGPGANCYIGIPVDDALRARAVLEQSKGRSQPLSDDQRAKMDDAVRRYRAGDIAEPFGPEDYRRAARTRAKGKQRATSTAHDSDDEEQPGNNQPPPASLPSDDLDG